MKSTILTVRVTGELYEKLSNDSFELGITNSENIRSKITKHFSGELIENEIYNSSDFIFLIAWLFEKKANRYNKCNKQELINLTKILQKVISSNCMPSHLLEELDNVLNDINRFIKEFDAENNHFRFCVPYQDDTFDYTGIMEYIVYKASENQIQL